MHPYSASENGLLVGFHLSIVYHILYILILNQTVSTDDYRHYFIRINVDNEAAFGKTDIVQACCKP